jgi:hypothetical protein
MTPIRRHAVMLAAAALAVFASAPAATAAASPATAASPPAAAAAGPACLPWTSVQPSTPGNSNNVLASVAALSSGNVWAAGSYYDLAASQTRTLIEHWNGSSWTQLPTPSPSSNNSFLTGIAAVSADDIWAVGYYSDDVSDVQQTLILHWNGTAWKHGAIPSRIGSLNGVTAISARDAWAVGYYWNGTANQTLIEHWNGTRWRHIPSPDPGDTANENELDGIAASAAADLWAVGEYTPFNNSVNQTMALHRC